MFNCMYFYCTAYVDMSAHTCILLRIRVLTRSLVRSWLCVRIVFTCVLTLVRALSLTIYTCTFIYTFYGFILIRALTLTRIQILVGTQHTHKHQDKN